MHFVSEKPAALLNPDWLPFFFISFPLLNSTPGLAMGIGGAAQPSKITGGNGGPVVSF